MPAVPGDGMAFGMEVAVKAVADFVRLQKRKDFFTAVDAGDGRIMQEDNLLPLPRRFKGTGETEDFPVEKLFVVWGAFFFFIEPAAGSAEDIVTIRDAVIVQKREIGKAVPGEKPVDFGSSGPPVIVVAFEEDFLTGKRMDEGEVRQTVLKIHPPAQIAAENNGIGRRQGRKAGF